MNTITIEALIIAREIFDNQSIPSDVINIDNLSEEQLVFLGGLSFEEEQESQKNRHDWWNQETRTKYRKYRK